MFQGRLKHLRFHELDEIAELKTNNEFKLKADEDQHRLAEGAVKGVRILLDLAIALAILRRWRLTLRMIMILYIKNRNFI